MLEGVRDEVEDGAGAGVVNGAAVPVVSAVVLRQHVVVVLHTVVGTLGGAEGEGRGQGIDDVACKGLKWHTLPG